MINEMYLLDELEKKREKAAQDFVTTDDILFCVEVACIDDIIKLINEKQRYWDDRYRFPKQLLDEWDTVTIDLRRYLK